MSVRTHIQQAHVQRCVMRQLCVSCCDTDVTPAKLNAASEHMIIIHPISTVTVQVRRGWRSADLLMLAMQVALGQQSESICVERGGPPKPPVFGGANPASVPMHIRTQVWSQLALLNKHL